MFFRYKEYINFPSSLSEVTNTQRKFYEIAHFPKVIGAIDCTHIRIINPGGNQAQRYINRKKYYSLNVQVICDFDGKITNIVTRWPGGTHDARIFDNCEIEKKFDRKELSGILLGDNK